MSDHYSKSGKRTVYYSSSSGGQQQSNVSETVSFTDSDGQVHTQTRNYQGGRCSDEFLNFNPDNLLSSTRSAQPQPKPQQASFGQRLKTVMDTAATGARRYSSGWGSRKPNRYTPAKTMSVQGKSFAEIKKECLAKGVLFEDPEFPAVDQSIFYSQRPPRPFVWKRPKDLVEKPHLFVGGASRFDVKQGELGDCWLLAAVSSLCGHKDLLYRVVPPNQSFEKDYCGIFCFQFWQYGEWTEVVIDDRLPTYYNKLVFMHSAENTEFWTPLLEKAYAKLVGSYEALKGGATSEAMEDFTGGVTEVFDFRQDIPSNLWQIMRRAFDRDSLMGCSIEASPGEMESELANGLIIGHAYSITSVKMAKIKLKPRFSTLPAGMVEISTNNKTGKIPMVRIRNPWGNECEWKGAWSDKSQQWKFITPEERQRIGLTFTEDGEFWMSFQDFTKNYQKLEICNLGPDSMSSGSVASTNSEGLLMSQPHLLKKKWEQTNHIGSWRKHVNAGGCRNFLDTFWTNPQYRVEVIDADEDDEDNCGTLIVALMQKGRRKLRKEGITLLTLGYAIYRLKDPDCGPLDLNFFKYNASVAKAPAFINLREVCGRHKLLPGHYCIVPSSFEPGEQADFLLRIFSEKPNVSSEIDEATAVSKKDTIRRRVAAVTYTQPQLKDYAKEYIDKFDKEEEDPEGTMDITPEREEETASMREAFRKLAGEDMEIDAYELREILDAALKKEFKFEGFADDTCRGMVAMMDVDQSGKLGYDEFRILWSDVKLWKTVFKKFDKDQSGTFNSYELRQALRATGYTVSNATFNTLVMRYSHKDGTMYFDDYLRCVIRMKTMFATFADMKMPSGKAEFSLDQFIQTTMYS